MARTYSRISEEVPTTQFASNRQRIYESTIERHQINYKTSRIYIHPEETQKEIKQWLKGSRIVECKGSNRRHGTKARGRVDK